MKMLTVKVSVDFAYDVLRGIQDGHPLVEGVMTGLYALLAIASTKTFNIRRENEGKRAVVTVRRGGGDPQSYVYDYVMGDWSLTRPSGVEKRKDRVIEDERAAQVVKDVLSPSGELLSRSEKNYKWEGRREGRRVRRVQK